MYSGDQNMKDGHGEERRRLVLSVEEEVNPNRVAALVQVGNDSPPVEIEQGEAIDLEAALEVSEEVRITADDLQVALAHAVGERLHRNFQITDVDSVRVQDLVTELDACVDFNAAAGDCEITVIMKMPVAVDPVLQSAPKVTAKVAPTDVWTVERNLKEAQIKLKALNG
jgi:hypothetical protein